MHNSSAQDDERILIYTTYDNIQYSGTSTLFNDGTFKTAPTKFTQVLCSVVLGYTTPLIYALTMKRHNDTALFLGGGGEIDLYIYILAFAQERNVINHSLCMTDFKIANINVI